MSIVNLTGKISKIFMNTKGFIIAKITVNDDTYSIINFKGPVSGAVKINAEVSFSGKITTHPTFGMQVEGKMILGKEAKLIPTKTDFKLTEEQTEIIKKTTLGHTLKIKAFAGTGKTSTLIEIANQLPTRGLYLAYNKSTQLEAQAKFPDTVVCKTAHSLAYGYMYDEIQNRVKSSLTPTEFMHYVYVAAKADYTAFEIAFLAIKVLRLYCISWHKEIAEHFFDHSDFTMLGEKEDKDNLMRHISILAEQYWDICKTDLKSPIEHDFYLKMFQLRYLSLAKRFDYIMFDEAQDANPVLLDIINRQNVQKIYVGDSHQQIYSWRGAINAMRFLDGEDAYLTQSFRFGSAIADIANILLKFLYEKEKLIGFDKAGTAIVTKKPTKYTLLSRTNAQLIQNIVDNKKKKLHVVGGIDDALALAKSGFALFQGRKQDVTHSKLKYFHSWGAIVKFNENFSDPDIGFLVKMIDKHKEKFKDVIRLIEFGKYTSEATATIIISTIHKAKGREWDNVILCDDFPIFQHCECFKEALRTSREEFNLLYVGVTRAKKQLMLEKGTRNFINRVNAYITPKTVVEDNITKSESEAIEL